MKLQLNYYLFTLALLCKFDWIYVVQALCKISLLNLRKRFFTDLVFVRSMEMWEISTAKNQFGRLFKNNEFFGAIQFITSGRPANAWHIYKISLMSSENFITSPFKLRLLLFPSNVTSELKEKYVVDDEDGSTKIFEYIWLLDGFYCVGALMEILPVRQMFWENLSFRSTWQSISSKLEKNNWWSCLQSTRRSDCIT